MVQPREEWETFNDVRVEHSIYMEDSVAVILWGRASCFLFLDGP